MVSLHKMKYGVALQSPKSRVLRPGTTVLGAALLAVLVAVVLTGCQSDDSSAVPTQGATGGQQLVDTITVSGTATISATPDEAVITVSVETDGPTPAEALDANSKQAQAVLDRLKAEGVSEEAVDTQNVTVYPIKTYNPETGQETLSGYRAQNTVRVTLSDIGMVGKVLAAATEAGSNNIMGPEWRLSDDAEAVKQALQEATANARQKAEVLAAAANVTVGEVLALSETGAAAPPVMYESYLSAAADSARAVQAPPISPTELDVVGSVTVTYRIER